MITQSKQQEYLDTLNTLLQGYNITHQEKRLIAASLQALTAKGYKDTTVDDIVSTARASKSTFYKYFRNKEAVLIRTLHLLVDVLINKVEADLGSHPSTSKRTYYAIRTYIETCFLHREVTKLLMMDTVGVTPSLETTRLMLHRYFFDIFHREIQAAVRNNNLTGRDPWVLSYAMVGAVQEVIIQSLILDTPPDPDHLAKVLEELMSPFLLP